MFSLLCIFPITYKVNVAFLYVGVALRQRVVSPLSYSTITPAPPRPAQRGPRHDQHNMRGALAGHHDRLLGRQISLF